MHDNVQHHHSEDLVNPIMPIAVPLNEYREGYSGACMGV